MAVAAAGCASGEGDSDEVSRSRPTSSRTRVESTNERQPPGADFAPESVTPIDEEPPAADRELSQLAVEASGNLRGDARQGAIFPLPPLPNESPTLRRLPPLDSLNEQDLDVGEQLSNEPIVVDITPPAEVEEILEGPSLTIELDSGEVASAGAARNIGLPPEPAEEQLDSPSFEFSVGQPDPIGPTDNVETPGMPAESVALADPLPGLAFGDAADDAVSESNMADKGIAQDDVTIAETVDDAALDAPFLEEDIESPQISAAPVEAIANSAAVEVTDDATTPSRPAVSRGPDRSIAEYDRDTSVTPIKNSLAERTEPQKTAPQPTAAPVGLIRDTPGLQLYDELAAKHVSQGFGASNRGMLFTGRREFLAALEVIADAKDLRSGTRRHRKLLAEAMTALEEAKDFVPSAAATSTDTAVSQIVVAHRTAILKDIDTSSWLPVAALTAYHKFAQQQLGLVASGEQHGSMALYGLGRMADYQAQQNPAQSLAHFRLAMLFHGGAIIAHQENHLAAHELGVLLARHGHLDQAREMLVHSVDLHPTQIAFHNLSVVESKLGRKNMARIAAQQSQAISKRAQQSADDWRVTWMNPQEFSRTTEHDGTARRVASPPNQSGTPDNDPRTASQDRLFDGWFPSWKRK